VFALCLLCADDTSKLPREIVLTERETDLTRDRHFGGMMRFSRRHCSIRVCRNKIKVTDFSQIKIKRITSITPIAPIAPHRVRLYSLQKETPTEFKHGDIIAFAYSCTEDNFISVLYQVILPGHPQPDSTFKNNVIHQMMRSAEPLRARLAARLHARIPAPVIAPISAPVSESVSEPMATASSVPDSNSL
jgi:hypothetical protein